MVRLKVVGVLVVISATFLFGGVVSAEEPDTVDPEDEPRRVVTHTVEAMEVGAEAMGGEASDTVWTCYIDLDHPHYSHHADADKINVAGEVNCDQVMEVLAVRMTLWKQSCLWMFCVWDKIGDSEWKTYPATVYAEVSADGPCTPDTESKYYGRLNAEMTWPNGDTTSGYNVSPIVEVLCAYQ